MSEQTVDMLAGKVEAQAKEIDELKAHICAIVSAAENVIEHYDVDNNIVVGNERSLPMEELLTSIAVTPAQSLAEHNRKIVNETVEKCVAACSSIYPQDYDDVCAGAIKDEILKLKEGDNHE